MLEGLIDQRPSEEEKALGTIDDLVNNTESAAEPEENQQPADAAQDTQADEAPVQKSKTPAKEATIDDLTSDIPQDLLDEKEQESDSDEYDIDKDEGVSDELRADIKKQPLKTQEAFAKMRIQLREYEKGMKEAAQGGLTDAEKEALIKQNQELQDRIEKADFVKSPRFQKEYIDPINALANEMVEVGKDYGIEEADMKHALGLPRAARAEFLAEKISNHSGLSELLPMYNQYGTMMAKAKGAIENFNKEATASIALEREQMAKSMASNLSKAQEKLLKEGFSLLRDSKTNPEWLPNLKKEAAAIVAGEVDPMDSAEAALRAVVAKRQVSSLAAQLSNSQKEIESLRSQLSKYVKLSPNNRADRSSATPSEIDPNKATIDDLVRDTIGV